MDNNLVEIVSIIDASGSMRSKKAETISGYNEFLEQLQSDHPDEDLRVTTVTFNGDILEHNLRKDINGLDEWDKSDYSPMGTTSLYDAMGTYIDKMGKIYADLPEEERPGNVIFLVLTDGLENTSREYNAQDVKERVERQEDVYSWRFVFMGADENALLDADAMGIKEHNFVQVDNNARGMQSGIMTMSAAVKGYTSGDDVDLQSAYKDNFSESN